MSKWAKDFSARGAAILAGYFGEGIASGRIIDLSNQSTRLSHIVLGEEYKKIESGEYQESVMFRRDGWGIVDRTNPKFCGVETIQMGAKLIVNEVEYTVDEAHRNGDVIDFRLVRRPPAEFLGNQDYRRE